MSGPNTITVSGNLTADPEMRRTATNDVPFARLRIAVSRRVYVPEVKDFQDRHDGYFTVVAWRDLARHAAASLRKGDRVVVSGRLSRRSYEAQITANETETRHTVEIEAEDIGGSMRWYAWQRHHIRPLAAAAEGPGGGDDDGDDAAATTTTTDQAVAPAA